MAKALEGFACLKTFEVKIGQEISVEEDGAKFIGRSIGKLSKLEKLSVELGFFSGFLF